MVLCVSRRYVNERHAFGGDAECLCPVVVGTSRQDVCQYAGLYGYRDADGESDVTFRRRLSDVIYGCAFDSAVRTFDGEYFFSRIPDVALGGEMVMGNGDCVTFGTDWYRTVDYLLLRTLLLLFSPNELHCDTRSDADTLSFVGGAASALARVYLI